MATYSAAPHAIQGSKHQSAAATYSAAAGAAANRTIETLQHNATPSVKGWAEHGGRSIREQKVVDEGQRPVQRRVHGWPPLYEWS